MSSRELTQIEEGQPSKTSLNRSMTLVKTSMKDKVGLVKECNEVIQKLNQVKEEVKSAMFKKYI